MIKEVHISIQSDMYKSSVCIDFITAGSISKRFDDIDRVIELLGIETISLTTVGSGAYLFSQLKEKYPNKEINIIDCAKDL